MSRQATTKTGYEQALADAVASAFDSARQTHSYPCVVRATVPAPDLAPLTWLACQRTPVKCFWGARDGVFEIAGAGAADLQQGNAGEVLGSVTPILEAAPDTLRYIGGVAFSPDSVGAAPWSPFGQSWFVLPRLEAAKNAGETYVACNAIVRTAQEWDQAREAALEAIRQMSTDDSQSDPVPHVTSRRDEPIIEQWSQAVNETLERIESGEIEKAVLARTSRLAFDGELHPEWVLRALTATTGRSFQFMVQPAEGAAFVGASPERLYARLGRRVESEALAGTRPTAEGDAEDQALGAELLRSDKDRREQAFVADMITGALRGLCTELDPAHGPEVLRLERCQHLLSRINGTLRPGVSDAEILAVLHPTPAVAGVPTDKAVRLIAELESFQRGWYAGAVGALGYDEADFAVGIRAGLVARDRLTVYAGAGIVNGSEAEAEWQETETKMDSFIRAFLENDA